ncbi:conserved protein, unknown function, partial [Hepatocystis sp. ex Piliocolobus tephrosceles]
MSTPPHFIHNDQDERKSNTPHDYKINNIPINTLLKSDKINESYNINYFYENYYNGYDKTNTLYNNKTCINKYNINSLLPYNKFCVGNSNSGFDHDTHGCSNYTNLTNNELNQFEKKKYNKLVRSGYADQIKQKLYELINNNNFDNIFDSSIKKHGCSNEVLLHRIDNETNNENINKDTTLMDFLNSSRYTYTDDDTHTYNNHQNNQHNEQSSMQHNEQSSMQHNEQSSMQHNEQSSMQHNMNSSNEQYTINYYSYFPNYNETDLIKTIDLNKTISNDSVFNEELKYVQVMKDNNNNNNNILFLKNKKKNSINSMVVTPTGIDTGTVTGTDTVKNKNDILF